MQNAPAWKPTKYVIRAARLRASRDVGCLGVGSRLMADLIANRYESALREHGRGDLLDLGCGTAPLYIVYRDLATSITCVDWEGSAHDVRHADVLCDLNRPIPLPDASFDTILFSDVLEHLYRPREAMAEIARLLRPGGKLLLNVPFFYWLHEAPHDYFRYTCFALERLARDAGLTPLVLEPLGGAPEVLADLVGKLAARVRFIGPPFASFTQATCYRLVGTRLGRRVSQATARQFPLGYFMVAQAP